MFKKATKEQAKLRMAITGPAGSGKTFTALRIARQLVPDAKIALLDTEHGSASKYADEETEDGALEFDVASIPNNNPMEYIKVIRGAERGGYDVLIIDSLSHAWVGDGGVLDVVDQKTKASRSKNSYVAWKDGSKLQQKLFDAILASRIHVIATMRVKTAYELAQSGNRSAPQKVGLAPVQRDGADYEFDVVLDMSPNHMGTVSKTRCKALDEQMFDHPGENIAAYLREWLSTGVEPAPAMTHDQFKVELVRLKLKESDISQLCRDKNRPIPAEMTGEQLESLLSYLKEQHA